ncbi:MAG: hypothetical protein R3B09_07555 [Nannocystaceae bacterium]
MLHIADRLRLRAVTLLAVGLSVAACKDNYEMVTVALQTATAEETETMGLTDVTASGTEGTDGTAGTAGTDGTATGSTASTAGTSTAGTQGTGETTGEPAPCDTAPDCTAMGDPDGELGPTDVPFFRGRVCVAKEAKPGQMVPVRLEACVHPCLKFNAFAFRHTYRCTSGCESAAVLWYGGVTGTNCPSDVFAKFDPALCKTLNGIDILAGPVNLGDNPYEGALPVLIPMLTNDQVAEISGGADTAAEIWARVDVNQQSPDRTFEVNLSASAADAPASCKDSDLCQCHDVGF